MVTKLRDKVVQRFDFEPGRKLGGNYEVLSFLGRGYEGEVYRVLEAHTGIERAAKLYFPHRNPNNKALVRYALKLNKLKTCPVIIQYHHQDQTWAMGRRIIFVVSDYVDGEMLSEFVARQPGKRLPEFEALHVLYALAKGLEPIHFLREYHGDIHSNNILIKRRGVGFDVKLLDFFDLGRPSREKTQEDIFDLINVFHEILGGAGRYAKLRPEVKQFIRGQKRSLIQQYFRNASDLKRVLENMAWETRP